eukprot:Sdes_comp20631_c0_seq1m15778
MEDGLEGGKFKQNIGMESQNIKLKNLWKWLRKEFRIGKIGLKRIENLLRLFFFFFVGVDFLVKPFLHPKNNKKYASSVNLTSRSFCFTDCFFHQVPLLVADFQKRIKFARNCAGFTSIQTNNFTRHPARKIAYKIAGKIRQFFNFSK